MSETKKVDPGWNDPPMLNYSATQPPPKSRIGNKRVPFPLGQSTGSQKPLLPSNIPPPDNDSLEEAIPNMADVTFTNFNSVLSSEVSSEVRDKVKVIEEMWRADKFPTSLKNYIYKLSDSIVQKDYATANKLNLELHIKFPNHCKDWILAIRSLIHDK